jgi:cobalt-zinc-cadmium efflux system membrane fusion protein
MHVKADIEIGRKPVELAVKVNAIQVFENNKVIFEQQENNFTTRTLSLGERDDQWVEVISGIALGTKYVSENSFLIKADLLKSGAGHDH